MTHGIGPRSAEGVLLTIAAEADIDDLLSLPSAEPFLTHWTTRERVEKWIHGQILDISADHACLRWVVRDASTRAFIGTFEASISDDAALERRIAALTVQRLPNRQGQAVTRRAIAAAEPILRDARVEWLLAKIRSDNPASRAAVLGAGFHEDFTRIGIFDARPGALPKFTEQFFWRRLD